MANATVPVQVAEDAAARVERLGMRRELEQMIEYAQQTTPGLRRIWVRLEYNPECVHEEPQVVIWLQRDEPPANTYDRTWRARSEWCFRTFPPGVLNEIGMTDVYGDFDEW
jgi:hypothetical protein